jgi:hypothetical protein
MRKLSKLNIEVRAFLLPKRRVAQLVLRAEQSEVLI